MRLRSSPHRSAYEPTAGYLARRRAVLPQGYVAVHSTTARNALVHAVKAGSFGELVRKFRKFGLVATECALAVNENWAMVSREGTRITCNHCRAKALNES